MMPSAEKRVPAVQRAARILRTLAGSPVPLGVNELARATEVIPSTCLHILRTLVEEGLVAVDPASKRYRPGIGLLALARGLLAHSDFAQEAEPALRQISARHNVAAMATELDGRGHMVVVALAHARAALSIHVEVGSRFPALISASGRCYAAALDMPDARLHRAFDRLRWQNPPQFDDWLEEVRQARLQGYAFDRDNYIAGITVVAAPVSGPEGSAARGLAAVGLSDQLRGPAASALAQDLKKAANGLASAPQAAATAPA